jgi:ketosteroid isomerase-like protein
MSIAQSQDVLQFEVRELIAEGDKVVVLGFENWKVKSTQKDFKTDWVHIYTIRGAEIIAVSIFGTTNVLADYQKD